MDLKLVKPIEELTPKEILISESSIAEFNNLLDTLEAKYINKVYTADMIKEAKEDKANINKAIKILDRFRIDNKNLYLEPYDKVEYIINKWADRFKKIKSKPDEAIKEVNEKEKKEKLNDITKSFNEMIKEHKVDWLKFNLFFNQKMLNKSYSMSKITEELFMFIKKCKDEIVTVYELDSKYVNQCVAKYQKSCDLAEVLKYNREMLDADKKAEIEANTQVKIEDVKINKPEEKISKQKDLAVYTLTLEFKATRPELVALKQYLVENKIKHKKIIMESK